MVMYAALTLHRQAQYVTCQTRVVIPQLQNYNCTHLKTDLFNSGSTKITFDEGSKKGMDTICSKTTRKS